MKRMFRFLDEKSGLYEPLWFSVNQGTALRDVQEQLDTGRLPENYARDFALMEVGIDDLETGLPKTYESPKHVINVRDMIIAKESD